MLLVQKFEGEKNSMYEFLRLVVNTNGYKIWWVSVFVFCNEGTIFIYYNI